MNQERKILSLVILVAGASAGGVILFRHLTEKQTPDPVAFVEKLPAESNPVLYLVLSALKEWGGIAELGSLAPQAAVDEEYKSFVRETGFDYEKNLTRLAIGFDGSGPAKKIELIAQGQFDRTKIFSCAAKNGAHPAPNSEDTYLFPRGADGREKELKLTKSSDLAILKIKGMPGSAKSDPRDPNQKREIQERALRLAGSPVFAILRMENGNLAEWIEGLLGGIRSPQIRELAGILKWITIAARPDGERLRIVVEAETPTEESARQVKTLLENITVMARIALEEPAARARMRPAERAALVELLQSAEFARLDRGEMQSVRLMFSAGPKVFEAIRSSAPTAAPPEKSAAPPAGSKGRHGTSK